MLSLFEAVSAGGDDALSGRDTPGDPDAGLVFGEVNLVQRNRARGLVDDPDKSLSAFFEHG